MIVRCPICTKDAPAGSIHTCTPTHAWRQAWLQIDRYQKALGRIADLIPDTNTLEEAVDIASKALD